MVHYCIGLVWRQLVGGGGLSNSQQRVSLSLLQAPCPFLFSFFFPINPMSFSEFLLSVEGYFVYPVKNLRGLFTLSLQGPSKLKLLADLSCWTQIYILCKLLFKSDSWVCFSLVKSSSKLHEEIFCIRIASSCEYDSTNSLCSWWRTRLRKRNQSMPYKLNNRLLMPSVTDKSAKPAIYIFLYKKVNR